MGTITNEQYESLKNKMKAICDSALKLKKIQGAYEFSENKKQFFCAVDQPVQLFYFTDPLGCTSFCGKAEATG